MADFPKHTRETAPEGTAELFDMTEKKFGITPNLIRHMSESPQAARAYLTLGGLFQESALSAVEQQVVLLAASFENRCEYCVAAHSMGAKGAGAEDGAIEALRGGAPLADPRLDALARFARALVRERGWVPDAELDRFLAAGFERRHVLDVILGIAMKTLSNYTNHVVGTELDEPFRAFAWTAPADGRTTAAAG